MCMVYPPQVLLEGVYLDEGSLALEATLQRTGQRTAAAAPGRPDSTKVNRLRAVQLTSGCAAVALAAKALPAPAPPTPYLLMLRVCQGKASPLNGVTPSCCPRPLLQLATQCCALAPEERPGFAAMLEQLQSKVLRSIQLPTLPANLLTHLRKVRTKFLPY